MNQLKHITNFIYYLLVFILISIAALSAMSVFGYPSNLRVFVVRSGSMEPAIKTGSLVFIRPQPAYHQDDIVTFRVGDDADIKNPKATITHRIIQVYQIKGQIFYVTQGDANPNPDLTHRSADLVLGKVILALPYLGFPVGFAKTQTGFILLVVVPATIIAYSEILNIKKQISLIIQKKVNENKIS